MHEPIIIEDANFAIAEALRGGAEILRSLFMKDYESCRKMDSTLVTEADLAVNEFILGALSEKFPDAYVDSEEERASEHTKIQSSNHWILDPLDGTQNFAMLNPYFGIALGLVSDDIIIAGGVIQPFTDLFFSFGGSRGALINGNKFPRTRIAAASIKESAVAFIPTATSHKTEFARRTHATIYKSCRRLIDNWAPSLDWCSLATGRIDAIVSFGTPDRYQDFDAQIGKALFQEVWQRDAHIEKSIIHIENVPHLMEVASTNSDLVQNIQERLLNQT